jgi:hypothetical protein
VDERTQMKFSDFFLSKSGMAEPTCELFQRWKDVGREVRYLRMDNTDENKLLQSRCESVDWKFWIQPEYTASYTPQQNHLAELGFAILSNPGRAMMARANVALGVRYKIWRHAFKTATLLDGLNVVTVGGKMAAQYVLWAGENPKFADHLRTWGEAGSIKTRVRGTPKIAHPGTQCMMVGYSTDHAGDCYQMWDPLTGNVHDTRDVTWMHRMLLERQVGLGIVIPPTIIAGIDEIPAGCGEGMNNDAFNEET